MRLSRRSSSSVSHRVTQAAIAQLIQRSNQFNLTTRRHSEAQCAAMMRNAAEYCPFAIAVKDRFGDFGIVNIVILRLHREERVVIDTFLMSCRVLQRGVEQFSMNKVFEFAHAAGCQRVTGRYIPTAKNAMVQDFYAGFDFSQDEGAGGEGVAWSLAVSDYVPRAVYVEELIPAGETT